MYRLLAFALAFAPLFASLPACSGSDSGGPGIDDPDADPGETPAADAAPVDEPDSGPAACGSLTTDPVEVFVDPNSARESIGTQPCPFLTIEEAAALEAPAGTRTIYVAGADPALTYELSDVLLIRSGERLVGEGEDAVLFTGGGGCFIDDCVISIRGGGVSGITAVSETGIAIEVPAGNDGSTISNVTARDSDRDGLYVRSSVTIANVTSRGNGRDGLNARTGIITIVDSKFDRNDNHGIFADQQVTIQMVGGSINSNRDDGAFLADNSGVGREHSVSGVDVIQNLGFGIAVFGPSSLTLRDTTLRSNEVGVSFRAGASNFLDIGTAADPGGNHFGGATGRNVRSGLCIVNSGANGSQVGEGNLWRSCAPTQREINGSFCVSQNTYSDVGFVPSATGGSAPLAPPADCEVGP